MNPDYIIDDVVLTAHGLGQVPEEWRATPTLRQLAGVIDLAREIVISFRAQATEWRTQLKDDELARRLVARADQETARLMSVAGPALEHARADRARLAARLAERGTAPRADVAQVALHREIRDRLLAMQEPDRLAALTRALEDGEAIVTDAVLSAPGFVQRQIVTTPDLLVGLRERVQEKTAPGIVGALEELDLGIRRAMGAVSSAHVFIGNTKGLAEDASARIMTAGVMAGILPAAA